MSPQAITSVNYQVKVAGSSQVFTPQDLRWDTGTEELLLRSDIGVIPIRKGDALTVAILDLDLPPFLRAHMKNQGWEFINTDEFLNILRVSHSRNR